MADGGQHKNSETVTFERLKEVLKFADFHILPLLLAHSFGMNEEPLPAVYPEWVLRCGAKVTRARFPQIFAAMKENATSDAYKAGLAYSMMRSASKLMVPVVERVTDIPDPTGAEEQSFKEYIYGKGAAEVNEPLENDFIAASLKASVEQLQQDFTLQEQEDFHKGNLDAVEMLAGKNRSTETTEIYTFMLIFWRIVEVLPSLNSFRDLLIKVYGENAVGSDPKRLAQMCLRIGKNFGPPGRPPLIPST